MISAEAAFNLASSAWTAFIIGFWTFLAPATNSSAVLYLLFKVSMLGATEPLWHPLQVSESPAIETAGIKATKANAVMANSEGVQEA